VLILFVRNPKLMKRRYFIRSLSIAGVSLPILSLSACNARDPKSPLSKTDNDLSSFQLDEETIDSLQNKMKEGSLTSARITQLYLARIEEIDKKGPSLNSVIEINPDALSIAEEMDRERKDGKVRGPLHGIPVLIKDNIDTGDKMMTTAGSLALLGHRAKQDAFIVKQLRISGAVLLGKTNLSEWANFRSTRSSSGWSSRGGQTKNPFMLDRNPCGSSSGSGTAVSANLCAVAIGTETNGSIACPSSINGIVGFKPTVGLWSRTGIIPISQTQDTAGPMTRTVRDAALLLGALTGTDETDPASKASEGKSKTDYTPFLVSDGLRGKKIGVEKSYLKVHEAVDALLVKALDQIRGAGAEIIEVDFRKMLKIEGAEYQLLQFEFKDGLNKYLSTSTVAQKSLKDIIAYNKQHEDSVMPYFKQEILESSEEKSDLGSKEYKEALEKILSVRTTIDNALKEFKLDAICGPTNGPSWCTDLVNGDSFTGYGMYSAAAMAGYPHVTVPMGVVEGLPIGLCFFTTAYAEGPLLSIAYSYEQLSKNRTRPTFKKTLQSEDISAEA
jgi:amidase